MNTNNHFVTQNKNILSQNEPAVLQLVLLNGFFVALWVSSALLFRRADARPD